MHCWLVLYMLPGTQPQRDGVEQRREHHDEELLGAERGAGRLQALPRGAPGAGNWVGQDLGT